MPKLILASASPRRKDLLQQVNIIPDIIEPSNIDESPLQNEIPKQYALRIAIGKAKEVSQKYQDDFVLSADTVVACGRRILPKAENDGQVAQCLKLLSGRQHTVISCVCLISPEGKLSNKVIETKVKFKRLGAKEINGYIESKEGIGKAGGYAIQGIAGGFVKSLNGSYSSVVGLPLYETLSMLEGTGYKNA
ncbi:MAG: septum formation protein Maf [Alphaproteobacteria bacterium CG11_big_fil_rev_8_21_14_0_20_39_49]|nr:MAG: septum formation protein Maf [Alphaproteobacteria bacterium CG11_big_fil_rev_8_21_14_0_20_39_49]